MDTYIGTRAHALFNSSVIDKYEDSTYVKAIDSIRPKYESIKA